MKTSRQWLDDRDRHALASAVAMVEKRRVDATIAMLTAQCCYAAATSVIIHFQFRITP